MINSAINANDQILESEDAIREADAIQKKSSDVSDLVVAREAAEYQVTVLGTVSKIITMQKHEKPKGEWTSNVEYYYQR